MTSLPHPRRWGIYLRISGRQGVRTGEDDDDTVSLDTQDQGCRELIARIDPTGTIDESLVLREIHTGTELFSRPKLTRMRDAVRRGEITAIACYQPKRWARDGDHAGYLKTELREYGAVLRFALNDPGDGDVGDVVGYLEHWTGKKEHADIVERTHRARSKLVGLGRAWASSKPPYGLRWRYETIEHPNGRIEQRKVGWDVEPVEARILVEMFWAVVNGRSLRGLAFDLTERGVPSPTGHAAWNDRSVRYLLGQRVYTGEAYGLRHQRDTSRPHLGIRGKSAGRRRYADRLRPEDEWVKLPDGYAPQVVEPGLFDAVQQVLATRQRGGSAPSATAQQTLMGSGRARCASCGNTLSRLGANRLTLSCSGRAMRKCPRPASIRMAALDAEARRLAYQIYTHPDVIVEQVEQHRASDPVEADLRMVDQSLTEIEQQEHGLLMVAAKVTTPAAAATLACQIERLGEQRERAQRDRAELLERRAGWDRVRAFVDGFARDAGRVRAHLDRSTHAEWQDAIDALRIEAVVAPGRGADRVRLTTRLDVVLPAELAGRFERAARDDAGRVRFMRRAPASTTHEAHLTLSWSPAVLAAFPAPPPPLTALPATG